MIDERIRRHFFEAIIENLSSHVKETKPSAIAHFLLKNSSARSSPFGYTEFRGRRRSS